MLRTRLYADPEGRFVHNVILESCLRFPRKTAIIDSSCGDSSCEDSSRGDGACRRRITYAEYGELIQKLARGLVAASLKPGEVIAIYLPNCWEFCAVYHAATLAGAIPTLLNPSYREREVRYQLENSGAVLLISDGTYLEGINLAGLANLRRVYTTRRHIPSTEPFSNLLLPATAAYPAPRQSSKETLAALPYSSGTTGL